MLVYFCLCVFLITPGFEKNVPLVADRRVEEMYKLLSPGRLWHLSAVLPVEDMLKAL